MGQDESETQTGESADRMEDGIPKSEESVVSLTGDFYRGGELERTASWRGRLDQTTNWAVVFVAAILTWAFTSADNPHYVILIGIFGVSAFLFMESVRYREYDIWRTRVRILQRDLFAEMYSPDGAHDTNWRSELAEELRNPGFKMPLHQALTHRLRRSYIALLLLLLAAWVARITVFKESESWRETGSILFISGEVVTIVVATYYVTLLAIAAWSARGSRVEEFQE